MNAGIRAVLRTALSEGMEVYACENGYQGLIDETVFSVFFQRSCEQSTTRWNYFKNGRCQAFQEKAVRDKCRSYLKSLEISMIVVLGGDGSFRGAWMLEKEVALKLLAYPVPLIMTLLEQNTRWI